MLTPEFRLTNEVGITDDVRQKRLSFDLDDKECFCSFLQNNFGSWKRYVLLLLLFPHVDLTIDAHLKMQNGHNVFVRFEKCFKYH
jgi:hypothetical protein